MNAGRSHRSKRSRGAILPLTAVAIVASVRNGGVVGRSGEARGRAGASPGRGRRRGFCRRAHFEHGSRPATCPRRRANAVTMAIQNTIVGTTIQENEVAVQLGSYHYNYSTQTFARRFPRHRGTTTTWPRSRSQHTIPSTFANVLGIAHADHHCQNRPRPTGRATWRWSSTFPVR